MTILVTGATGRIGRAFVSAFSKKHPEIGMRLVVRDGSKLTAIPKNSEVFEADLSKELPAGLCSGVDTVVHFAALVDASAPEGELMLNNLEATKRLVDAAKSAGVKRFIYCSSTSVFRRMLYSPIDEKHPKTPVNAYGRSKLLAEEYLRGSGLDYLILRPSMVYGKGFRTGFGKIASTIGRGKMKIIGSGKNRIPLIHVDDAVQAFILAVERRDVKNADFNLVGDEMPTQEELFTMVAEKLGVPPPSKRVPKVIAYVFAFFRELEGWLTRTRPKMVREYVEILAGDRVFSNEKAKRLLGFSPQVTVERGIGEFVQAMQQQQ